VVRGGELDTDRIPVGAHAVAPDAPPALDRRPTEAWKVKVPGHPEASYVCLDKTRALNYACRLHGATIHDLVER
jgi:hypothetical protein